MWFPNMLSISLRFTTISLLDFHILHLEEDDLNQPEVFSELWADL
jgi:hypothetical protein